MPDRKNIALAVFAVSVLLVLPAAVYAGVQTFTDVPPDDWAFDDVEWLAANELTNGCGDGTTFCPDDGVTRREMAAFTHRLATSKVVDAKTATNADLLDGKDSTAFLGTADTAADSDRLDGKDSTAFVEHGTVEMTVSGNAWMGLEGNTAARFTSATSFPGSGAAVISLAGPASIDGVAYGLESFDLCVIGFGGGYVTGVSVGAINSFGPGVDDDQYIVIPPDATDRLTGCYTYPVNSPIGQGVGLRVDLAGGGSVELWAVKSTWTMAAAVG